MREIHRTLAFSTFTLTLSFNIAPLHHSTPHCDDEQQEQKHNTHAGGERRHHHNPATKPLLSDLPTTNNHIHTLYTLSHKLYHKATTNANGCLTNAATEPSLISSVQPRSPAAPFNELSTTHLHRPIKRAQLQHLHNTSFSPHVLTTNTPSLSTTSKPMPFATPKCPSVRSCPFGDRRGWPFNEPCIVALHHPINRLQLQCLSQRLITSFLHYKHLRQPNRGFCYE
jgi:hypothetical protein